MLGEWEMKLVVQLILDMLGHDAWIKFQRYSCKGWCKMKINPMVQAIKTYAKANPRFWDSKIPFPLHVSARSIIGSDGGNATDFEDNLPSWFWGVQNLAFKTKTSRIHHGESKWHNSPKGGFVRGHDKPIPGSCDIYFPGGRNAKDNISSWSSKKTVTPLNLYQWLLQRQPVLFRNYPDSWNKHIQQLWTKILVVHMELYYPAI